MGVSDIFKLAPGPVDRNTATFLRVSDAEPGKLTGKRAPNSSLQWYSRDMDFCMYIYKIVCNSINYKVKSRVTWATKV